MKRQPGRAGVPNDQLDGGSTDERTSLADRSKHTSTQLDPRRLVTQVEILDLADALFGHEPFGVVDDESGTRWVCIRCGHRDANGGTANYLADGWRWRCHRCRFTGTRIALERAVLEDADALGELYKILADREISV